MKNKILILGICCCMFSVFACENTQDRGNFVNIDNKQGNGNDILDSEKELVKLFNSAYEASGDYEKVEQIFKLIEKKISELLKNPLSNNYSFSLLKQQGVEIVNSKDGKIKIFSWDDLSGGTMRSYTNLFYCNKDLSPIILILNDSQDINDFMTSNFDQIYSVQVNNETHYFTLGIKQTGGMSSFEILQFFTIKGNTFNFNDKMIRNNGELLSNIYSSNENFEESERLIVYNESDKLIKYIQYDDEGSNKEYKFKFDGLIFK